MKYRSNKINTQMQPEQIYEQNVLLNPLKTKIDNKINKILSMLGDSIRNAHETEFTAKIVKSQKNIFFDQFEKDSQPSTNNDPCNSRTFISQISPKDTITTPNQPQSIFYQHLENQKPTSLFLTIREAKSQVDSQQQVSQISEVIVSQPEEQDYQGPFNLIFRKCSSKSEGDINLYYKNRILQVPEEEEEELSNQNMNQNHQRKSLRPQWDLKTESEQVKQEVQLFIGKQNKLTQKQTITAQKVRKELNHSRKQANKLRARNI